MVRLRRKRSKCRLDVSQGIGRLASRVVSASKPFGFVPIMTLGRVGPPPQVTTYSTMLPSILERSGRSMRMTVDPS
jgi:hypothetical protein